MIYLCELFSVHTKVCFVLIVSFLHKMLSRARWEHHQYTQIIDKYLDNISGKRVFQIIFRIIIKLLWLSESLYLRVYFTQCEHVNSAFKDVL